MPADLVAPLSALMGPGVPLLLSTQRLELVRGRLLPPNQYFVSWSLSKLPDSRVCCCSVTSSIHSRYKASKCLCLLVLSQTGHPIKHGELRANIACFQPKAQLRSRRLIECPALGTQPHQGIWDWAAVPCLPTVSLLWARPLKLKVI